MINELVPPQLLRSGTMRPERDFPSGFIAGMKDAAHLVIGPDAFQLVEYGDLNQQLVVIRVPPVQLGLRYFTGIEAHITKNSRGLPNCNIVDPWIRYKDTLHRHPHMSSGGSLCHDSNEIVEHLRNGNYVNAVVAIVGKVGTHTPGGEHHVPYGVRVCSAYNRDHPTCYEDSDSGAGPTMDLHYCNCNAAVCITHSKTCARCRARACLSCAKSIGSVSKCFTNDEPREAFLCNSCFEYATHVCSACGSRDSQSVKCAGCHQDVPRNCVKRCYYHNSGGPYVSDSSAGMFCANCAREDGDTANRIACYQCVPSEEMGGRRCGYAKHTHYRTNVHPDRLAVVRLEVSDGDPVEVKACTVCYEEAVRHAEDLVMLRGWLRVNQQ